MNTTTTTTMAHPDLRALCAELADRLENWNSAKPHHDDMQVVRRARAALAAPQQGAPSDEELDHIFVRNLRPQRRKSNDPEWLDHVEFRKAARAVLTRYGAQAVPVAEGRGQTLPPRLVAEELPSLDDCDERGYCWLYDDQAWEWEWATAHSLDPSDHTHWLPHWALPLPEAPHD